MHGRIAAVIAAALATLALPAAAAAESFAVTTEADSGPGSLRAAIALANANANAPVVDTLTFAGGVDAIALDSQLTVTAPLTIGAPGLALSGSGHPGLVYTAAAGGAAIDQQVSGVSLTGFSTGIVAGAEALKLLNVDVVDSEADGIAIAADGVQVGTTSLVSGSGGAGIRVDGDDVLIVDSAVSGSGGDGVTLIGTAAAQVVENEIDGNLGAGLRVAATAKADARDNAIHDNVGLAIDTASATSAAPAITVAGKSSGLVEVRITPAAAGGAYIAEVFRADECGDADARLARQITGSGAPVTVTVGPVAAGQRITATTTRDAETSELAACADPDAAPVLTFGPASPGATEGAGSVTFTFSRTGDVSGIASLAYATQDGTAVAGADYTATSGTVTFAADETTKQVQVPILDDAVTEPAQTFTLSVSDPVGATFSGAATATVTVGANDDFGQIVVNQGAGGDGDCGDGTCTLPEAIAAADADAGLSTIRFAEGVTASLTAAVQADEPLILQGPGTVSAGPGGVVLLRGGTAEQSQVLGLTVLKDDGFAVDVAGTDVLVQRSTLGGLALGAGTTGFVGTVAGSGNTIGAGGLAVGAGADVVIGLNRISGGVAVASQAVQLFDNAITGGLALAACADAQVITGNTIDGVTIGAAGCQLGGSGAGQGNTITGAPGAGVTVAAGDAVVIGNQITANGGDGVRVAGGAGSRIQGNMIFGNAGDGVRLAGGSAEIRDNAITGNGGLGIDGGADGPDGLRATLTSAVNEAGGLRVRGTLPAVAGAVYELELATDDACDPSGAGEGADPLGVVAIAAASAGTASFDVLLDVDVEEGRPVSATITRGGATGEYSGCAAVAGAPGGPAPGPGPGPGPGPDPGPDPELDPQSAITAPRGTRRARRVKSVKGSAVDAESVQVAVTRKGKRCKALTRSGSLKRRACSRPRYLSATGGSSWKLALKRRLPPGRYVIRSRAVAPDGSVETTPAKVTVRLRR